MEAGAVVADDGGGDGGPDAEAEAEIEDAQEERAPLDEERAGAVLEAGGRGGGGCGAFGEC